jgi:amidase
VPCGKIKGLPIGMMLVANHFDEASAIRASAAFESSTNWTKR